MSYTPYVGPTGPYADYRMNDATKVVGLRVAAKIIDSLISLPIAALVFWYMWNSATTFAVADSIAYCNNYQVFNQMCIPRDGSVMILDFNVWILYGPSVLLWLLFVFTEAYWGWTPGKLAMGLRVVRMDDGQNIGFGKSLIRALLWIIDGFCGGIVAFYTASTSPGHQRLGDRAASTLVVRKQAAGQRPVVPGLNRGPIDYQISGAGQAPPWAPGFPSAGPSAQPWQGSQYKADEPIWDEHRSAYIQYDTQRGAWLQYDDQAAAWKPIST